MVSPAPQASTRATASPGPGTGSGTVSSTNGAFFAFSTMAFMRAPRRPDAALLPRSGLFELLAQRFHPVVVLLLTLPVAVGETPAAADGAYALALERFPELLATGFHLAQRCLDVGRAIASSAARTFGLHPAERLGLLRRRARNA